MGEVISDLLPIIVAAITVPIYSIVALILLQSKEGLKKAAALLLGAVSVRLVQGPLFGFLFGGIAEKYPEEGPDIIVSTLLLVLGIFLLIKAYQAWQKERDPEDALPKWMSAVNDVSIGRAAGIGALYVILSPKHWVFTELAVSTILEAELGTAASVSLYLFFTLATQLFVLIPILMVVIAPQQAAKPLQAVYTWLVTHNQTILMVVSLIFGLWFTIKGIGYFTG